MSAPSKYVFDDMVTAFAKEPEPYKMSLVERVLKGLIVELLEINRELKNPSKPIKFKDLRDPEVHK